MPNINEYLSNILSSNKELAATPILEFWEYIKDTYNVLDPMLSYSKDMFDDKLCCWAVIWDMDGKLFEFELYSDSTVHWFFYNRRDKEVVSSDNYEGGKVHYKCLPNDAVDKLSTFKKVLNWYYSD